MQEDVGAFRRTGLPRPRAAFGALLITAAGVITFAAYMGAVDEPTRTVLVARDGVEAGTRIDVAERLFAARQVRLDASLSDAILPGEAMDDLAGRFLTAAVREGDPLLRTLLSDVVPTGVTVAFSVPRVDALDGSVVAGDRIDVLTTTRSGERRADTSYLLSDVEVRRARSSAEGIGSAGDVTITVVVPTRDDALALAHEARTGEITVVRAAGDLPAMAVRSNVQGPR